jgi:hypothetical protein
MFRNSPRQFECSDLIFKARQRNKNKLRCWNIPDCAQHPQTCDVVFPITLLFKLRWPFLMIPLFLACQRTLFRNIGAAVDTRA